MKISANIEDLAKNAFANHVMAPSEALSFRFVSRSPVVEYSPETFEEKVSFKSSSAYHFHLTWRPGALLLTGDLGTLVLDHPYALSKFEEALDWAVSSEFDYMMSKSNLSKVYDPEATYEHLIRCANVEALEELNGFKLWAGSKKEDGIRQKRLKVARNKVESERLKNENTTLHGEELEDAIFELMNEFEENELVSMKQTSTKLSSWGNSTFQTLNETWFIAGGWNTWVSYWAALLEYAYVPHTYLDDPDYHPTFVLRAKNRRVLKERLRQICQDQYELLQFLNDLGDDRDFSGIYRYPESAQWQISAIKHGCQMIQAAQLSSAPSKKEPEFA